MVNELEVLEKGVRLAYDVDVKSESRKLNYVNARYIFCYIAYNNLNMTYESIGAYLNRNHATVFNYVKKFLWVIKYDQTLKRLYKVVVSYLTPLLPDSFNTDDRRVIKAQIEHHKEMIQKLEKALENE